ncbi:cohesin domain-containing protein [Paenibacillus planticolens]|uniref:Cohesin domain-containing protein n=1 Tax=Paenibacillus planticolens TaxID=2654976 RepID=A0ABX1ZYY9_9BACL|nr:cohesin domain-containing protein [Paenibacillus planticolens]NOV03915.1 hypothetical protein [Paenibacillus planticolens]
MSKRIVSVITTLAMLICMLAIVPLQKAAAAETSDQINHVEMKVDAATQIVTFQGDISLGKGKDVTIMVTNPLGQLDYLNQTVSGSDGKFAFTYKPSSSMESTYTVKIGGEGVNLPYSGSFQLLNSAPASATLTGPASVVGGQGLDLKLGVNNSPTKFSILNVVLNYDPNHLQFETVTDHGRISLAETAISSLKANFNVLVTGVKPDKGQILIIMSSIGAGNEVSGGDLVTVHAKAKSVSSSVSSSVYLSEAAVSSEGSQIDLAGASLALQIQPLNKEALNALIETAQNKHDAAVEGTQAGQYPSGSKNVLQLAINNAKAVATNVSATEAEVQAAVSSLDAALRTFINSVITSNPDPADKAALNTAIVSAESKLNATVTGTKVGQYASESKAALQAAIASAKAVYDNSSATQAQVDAAKDEMDTALQAYVNSIITLVPGETKITIKDLSVIAKYYGTTSADANWSQIEKADIFGTGKIDIQVLAAVARMIIDDWLLED